MLTRPVSMPSATARVNADTINDALPGKSTRLVSGRMPMKILSFRDDDSLWLTDLDSMQSHLMAQRPRIDPKERLFEI